MGVILFIVDIIPKLNTKLTSPLSFLFVLTSGRLILKLSANIDSLLKYYVSNIRIFSLVGLAQTQDNILQKIILFF